MAVEVHVDCTYTERATVFTLNASGDRFRSLLTEKIANSYTAARSCLLVTTQMVEDTGDQARPQSHHNQALAHY